MRVLLMQGLPAADRRIDGDPVLPVWVVNPYVDANTYLRARNGFAAALERRMLR